MKPSEWCEGKWPEIIRTLIGPDALNGHQPCPRSGEGDDRFRFSDKNNRGNYFCGCSQGEKDGFELLMCVKGWDFPKAFEEVQNVIGKCPNDDDPQPDQPKKKSVVERISKDLITINKSQYLQGRGLEIAPGLQWHKALPYYVDKQKVGRFPAMIAPIKRSGKVLTYHATWLLSDDKRRKILPSEVSLQGSAVELYPITGDVLGVAEGVETAIAAKMLFKVPVWSLINTALMKSWKPPAKVKHVIVFGDNDENYAGQAAAFNLAHRLKMMDFKVTVKFPSETGQDFNDVLLSKST